MSIQSPDAWLDRLRAETRRTSQRQVAERLRNGGGYPSDALVSQVLAGKYQGRTDKLRRLVEGYYLGVTVACPVLGDISRHLCEHTQDLPFLPANFRRVELFRACRTCPNATTAATPPEDQP
jgi:hypothetical protein